MNFQRTFVKFVSYMQSSLFKAVFHTSVIRWEEMKGRTTRCKEADVFAVQNCKWIGRHGEPVRTSVGNLYVGHEKVQYTFFPPSTYILFFYTFADERLGVQSFFRFIILSYNLPTKKFTFKTKENNKDNRRISAIFTVKFLKYILKICKIFTG